MIHLKQNIRQTDAQWVLEFVIPKQGWRIDRTTLGHLADAHNRIFQEQVGVSGCSCEFKAQHQVWYSRLGQYDQQIRDIAYPPEEIPEEIKSLPTKSRGRKPKGTSGI